jgi:hypothetical protein
MTYPSLVLGIVLSAPALAWSPKPAQVQGLVTDEAGKPLGGVVWWISAREVWRDGKWELIHQDGLEQRHTTQNDGRFIVEFPARSRYDLQFSAGGFAPTFLYQIGPDSPEIHVKMRKGSLVQGRVTRTDRPGSNLDPTAVEIRLPNPRGSWYQTKTLVDHRGEFRFFASPPPKFPGLDHAPKWQVVCAGEVAQIDVEEGRPVDEVTFELTVKGARRPSGRQGAETPASR